MSDWQPVLKAHFYGEDGSFLLGLREDWWDRAAFEELVHAMKKCCIYTCATDTEHLQRWIAHGFWDTESYARMCVARPSFRLEHSREYFQAAIQLLHDLSYWYFLGESPAGPDIDPKLYSLSLPD